MATRYSPKIVSNGLIQYLDAGNIKSYIGSGNTCADLSKNGNSHTLQNTPAFSGANGGSIVFDGVDDFTQSNTDILLSGNYTLEIAFRRTSSRGDWVRIFGHSNDGSVRFWGLWIPASFDSVLWQSYRSGGEFSKSYAFSLNQDYVLTFSNTSTTATMYVNGISLGTGTTGTIDYTGNTSKITIGYAGFHTYHVGPLYYARIYNRALSGSEVFQNYNATKRRFGL